MGWRLMAFSNQRWVHAVSAIGWWTHFNLLTSFYFLAEWQLYWLWNADTAIVDGMPTYSILLMTVCFFFITFGNTVIVKLVYRCIAVKVHSNCAHWLLVICMFCKSPMMYRHCQQGYLSRKSLFFSTSMGLAIYKRVTAGKTQFGCYILKVPCLNFWIHNSFKAFVMQVHEHRCCFPFSTVRDCSYQLSVATFGLSF